MDWVVLVFTAENYLRVLTQVCKKQEEQVSEEVFVGIWGRIWT